MADKAVANSPMPRYLLVSSSAPQEASLLLNQAGLPQLLPDLPHMGRTDAPVGKGSPN